MAVSQKAGETVRRRGWSLSAFREGMTAAQAGKPVSDNPHDDNADQSALWRGGWQLGRELYGAASQR